MRYTSASAALLVASVILAAAGTAAAVPGKNQQAYATIRNFAPSDILDGDNGMPPHPFQPWKYGEPLYPVTTGGDGLELVEGHLSYFEGKYWMHSATWGCGTVWVYGRAFTSDYPATLSYPPGDYGADGNCGIKTFSSPDMTSWSLEDFYQPAATVANVTKPVVVYSNATQSYVMIMGGGPPTAFWYATGSSPKGPWSDPPSLMQGPNLGHDFDIAVGPDGTHYMVVDTIATLGNPTTYMTTPTGAASVPVWPIYVHQMNANLTGVVGTNDTMALVFSVAQSRYAKLAGSEGLTLEAIGFFYRKGFYYIVAGETCQNCAGYIFYLYATSPLGPYKEGGYISLDGCGGQNKGVMKVPNAAGEDVFLAGNLQYRTGPTNLVFNDTIWHADNNQAASSTAFFKYEFNDDGTIKPLSCDQSIQVPLAAGISKSPQAAAPYRLDCRVRNWESVVVKYNKPVKTSSLQFPVFQRTDNLGPSTNAGWKLNGPLNVTLAYADGSTRSSVYVSSNVSWAPEKISISTSASGNGAMLKSITLSTNATNGCYGNIVYPADGQSAQYGVQIAKGDYKQNKKAQMFVHAY